MKETSLTSIMLLTFSLCIVNMLTQGIESKLLKKDM